MSLKGHTDIVECLEVEKDKVFSASSDGTIKIWSTQTGQCLRTLGGHTGGVNCLCKVDNILYSGSWDNIIRKWDLEAGVCVKEYHGHTGAVLSICIVSGTLFSASNDRSIRIWDETSTKCTAVLEGHQESVRCLAVAGRVLYSGSADCTLRFWNWMAGTCVKLCTGHEDCINCITMTGTALYSGSSDGEIRVWDMQTGQCRRSFSAESSIRGIDVLGGLVFAACSDRAIYLWQEQAELETPFLSETVARNGLTALRVRDGAVWVASADMSVRAWLLPGTEAAVAAVLDRSQRHSSRQLQPLPFAPGFVQDTAESRSKSKSVKHPDTMDVEVSKPHGGAALWGTPKIFTRHADKVHAVCVVGSTLYTAGSDHAVCGTPLEDDAPTEASVTLEGHTDRVYCLCSDGASVLYSGSADGTARAWSMQTNSSTVIFTGHTDWVSCIDYSSGWVYTGSWDKTVRKWSASTGCCHVDMEGHTGPVYALHVCEGVAVSGSRDASARAWDVETGECIRLLQGHSDTVSALKVVDPMLFTASWDKTVRCWDIMTGEVLRVFREHTEPIMCLDVQLGLLVTGSNDCAVRCFRVDTGKCSATMEQHSRAVNGVLIHEGLVYSCSDDGTALQWELSPADTRHMLSQHKAQQHKKLQELELRLAHREIEPIVGDGGGSVGLSLRQRCTDRAHVALPEAVTRSSLPKKPTVAPPVKPEKGTHMAGWVRKRSVSFQRWSKRYATVDAGVLTCYASDKQVGGTALTVLKNIQDARLLDTAALLPEEGSGFSVTCDGQTHVFAAETKADATGWVGVLERGITHGHHV
eukprot:CAMPEP_0114568784 /NCGR_PEP_ID=MMETSP0114-20121206/16252_1 /TAXON_ID=31324 /ORGANISM="Goniomonas sp, Strain m" /LENGTH=808 /DNA_ID=CAMNT_0001755569 /DNA_START=38 /DNA_END=2464 /DNA_ORIENTATION=-